MNLFQYLAKRRRDKSKSRLMPVALSAALVIVMLISLTFTARAHSTLSPILNISASHLAGNAQESTPSQLTIRFSNEGISPASATVIAGRVLLKVENQRALERLTLRISRQGGELIREISVPDKATEWSTELELGAGQYVISEASGSAGSCQVTAQDPPASQ